MSQSTSIIGCKSGDFCWKDYAAGKNAPFLAKNVRKYTILMQIDAEISEKWRGGGLLNFFGRGCLGGPPEACTAAQISLKRTCHLRLPDCPWPRWGGPCCWVRSGSWGWTSGRWSGPQRAPGVRAPSAWHRWPWPLPAPRCSPALWSRDIEEDIGGQKWLSGSTG